jgi:hypothetical protein
VSAWPLYPLQPGEVYVNFGFWGTVPLPAGRADRRLLQPADRRRGREAGRAQVAVLDVVLRRGRVLPRYNGDAYRALKRAYDGEGRLLGLYEKCVTGR